MVILDVLVFSGLIIALKNYPGDVLNNPDTVTLSIK